MRRVLWLFGPLLLCLPAFADGPADNVPDKVRRIPPPGIKVPEEDRDDLQAGIDTLGKDIEELRTSLKGKAELLDLLPDVQVYHNAVRYALKYDEFFQPAEIGVARTLLQQGRKRAEQLRAGNHPWTSAPGLIVRGYVSKIDGSVQPYGLVVPSTYQPGSGREHRLDFWFHGRNEDLSELNFLDRRQKSGGEFLPRDAFVLHPYGRYCNANHFAGEIDTLEALEHVRRHYPIDEARIVVRGFSMGGAATWNFAVHYSDRWVAAAPGAGFSETPDFLRVFQGETIQPNAWQKKLLHLYDCTDWALNLYNVPTVAYSGAKDRQKQAADIMAKALASEKLSLAHIIGPDTEHSYHPQSKVELNRRIDSIVRRGRDTAPGSIRFTTWTLRYPRMFWVTVEGLEEHWQRALVDAAIDDDGVKISTINVTALSLDMPSGYCPLEPTQPAKITIDEQEIMAEDAPVQSDRSWTCRLKRSGDRWKIVKSFDDKTLRKRPGLQGPIDDAFMDRFVMVRPTGKSSHDKVDAWVDGELKHALTHWRQQFRAEIEPKNDTDIGDDDIASSNLILWGDPSSNRILAKIADKLPIRWDEKQVRVGDKTFDAASHVPALIYPNPLNPKKYVVLNSSFTFREYDYLNNARQYPHLPDWAVLDIAQAPTSQRPAGVAEAGFFDEEWKLTKAEEK